MTSSVTWSFDSQVPISYRRLIVTKSLSPAVSEIFGHNNIGVTTLTLRGHVTSSVTWPFDSHVSRWPFLIDAPLSPSRYLQPFPRYWALSIMGSRPWPCRVMWRRRSRVYSIPRYPFPIDAPLSPSRYLQPFSRYWPLSVLGSRPWFSGSRDVIGHVTIGLRMGHSYWWSFGPKSLSLTVSEIFSPKHHVLIDTMLNRRCACAISRDVYPCVKFKYIFQFLTPTLPIHNVTFIELRWRIRGVLSVTSNVKGQIEQKFSVQKFAKILTF